MHSSCVSSGAAGLNSFLVPGRLLGITGVSGVEGFVVFGIAGMLERINCSGL